MRRHWQLTIAATWLALAAAVLLREPLGLKFQQYSSGQIFLVLALAFAMAGWNLLRWWVRNRPRLAREPLMPVREAPPYEYNPELDFQKLERDQAKGG